MIRLATVGTSAITGHFLSGCALTDEFTLAAVCSRDPARGERFGAPYGCNRVFSSAEALAEAPDIDAVYIATPNVFHVPQSELFLKHGKHVLCEKPAVSAAAEYRRLSALAEKNRLVYTEAIMPRHIPARAAIRAAVPQLGRITQARIDFSQLSSRYDAFLRGEHVNIFDPALHEGALMDLGVYCVYAAVDLLGVPRGIRATASFLRTGADGGGTAVFDYGDYQAVLTYSKTGQSVLGSEIIGDAGTLKIASVSQYAGAVLIQSGIETVLSGHPERPELMCGEAQRFADYILRPAENDADRRAAAALALSVHTCMDRIKKSAHIVYP